VLEDPVFSPDGKRVAFRAMWKYKWIVAVDDGKGEIFDAVGVPVWSPDSARVAYAAQKDGKWFMVAGYRRLEAFDEVLTPPVWSPDGKKVAFGARKGQDLYWKVVPVQE
jgi:Tol biopolymer transport system component